MPVLFALFQRVSDMFESPFLPMDSDYSYQARFRESERARRANGAMFFLHD